MTHRPKLVKPEIADSKAHYEQVYKQAIYEVYNGQETIRVQIGECCLRLGHIAMSLSTYSHINHHSWAIITAANPYSQILTELENKQRHHKLRSHLQELQVPWLAALGMDQTGIWTPEPSFWISGIELLEAIAIGRQFEQNAIVYSELHQSAELQWL
ncbi:MAG: hypothetical protein RLZZ04_2038 [Cyanobacteriota bacterium]|jgi:hypothetical protein